MKSNVGAPLSSWRDRGAPHSNRSTGIVYPKSVGVKRVSGANTTVVLRAVPEAEPLEITGLSRILTAVEDYAMAAEDDDPARAAVALDALLSAVLIERAMFRLDTVTRPVDPAIVAAELAQVRR